MTDCIMIVLTAVIAFFAFLVWRVYARIEWFTGSMESHSETMLRIEAKRGMNDKPIKLVWWDPTIEPPPIKREHGQEVDMEIIYVFLPPGQRKNKPTWWARAKAQVQ